MDLIIEHLKKSNKVLVTTHIYPDGDAIGSLIAMGFVLAALNKEASLYTESPIPAVYKFIPFVHRVVHTIKDTACYDTAIVLDCSNPERTGSISGILSSIPVLINIDHHITNNRFGTFQLIDPQACATAEIIYRLIKRLDLSISKFVASAIYTAILTDTGSFRFCNTNSAAFKICEEMVTLGADPYHIAQQVYGQYSLGRIRLLNLALNTIEISENGKLSVMLLTREMFRVTGTRIEDGNDLIDYAKIIEDIKVAVLIQEPAEKVAPCSFHVSLRSDGTVDVAEIALVFGGGGHRTAAGFETQMPLPALRAELDNITQTFL